MLFILLLERLLLLLLLLFTSFYKASSKYTEKVLVVRKFLDPSAFIQDQGSEPIWKPPNVGEEGIYKYSNFSFRADKRMLRSIWDLF